MREHRGRSRHLWGERRGVSQVVAIALLVAIVVLLAAGIGTYLFTFGEGLENPAPQFAATTTYNDTLAGDGEHLAFTHESGDQIRTEQLRIRVDGARIVDPGGSNSDAEYAGDVATQVGTHFETPETIELNKSHFVDGSGNPPGTGRYVDLSDAVVRLVWSNPDGDETAIVFEWDGPNRVIESD